MLLLQQGTMSFSSVCLHADETVNGSFDETIDIE